LREQFAHVLVDGVEGFLELGTRFLVDAADRVFQRGDGFQQVGALRGEVFGTLLRLG
jgi:hypothetical protein